MTGSSLVTAALAVLCATAGAIPHGGTTTKYLSRAAVGHLQELNLEQVRTAAVPPYSLPGG